MLLLSEDAYLCAVAPLDQGSLGEGREQQEPAVEQPLGTEAHFVREQDPPHILFSRPMCTTITTAQDAASAVC
jgi:hypothetical protein